MSSSNSSTNGTNPTTFTNSTSSTYSDSSGGISSQVAAVGIGTGAVFVVVVAAIAAGFWMRRRRRRKRGDFMRNGTGHIDESVVGEGVHGRGSSHFGPRNYSYKELRIATQNFSQSELLGAGGFGSVYRGILAEDGTYVAVKCIAENSKQGAKEYKAEVNIISDLRHRNLVRLRGCCHDRRRFLLVYDYMPNGSLDYLLFNDSLCSKLRWERRYAIAFGLESALQYLHEECDHVIIHRDIKSSNVLLDENFVAKLGDFGLSRQVGQGITSHTTIMAGTRGYMAPEYFYGSGKATRETDVYAFGAVLLELVSGKRVIDESLIKEEGMLVDWVWNLHSLGKVMEAVDRRMEGRYEEEEARRMLLMGLLCSSPDPKSRPTMRRALESLTGSVALPPVPLSKPTLSFGPPLPMSMTQIMEDSTQILKDSASSNSNYYTPNASNSSYYDD